MQLGIALTCVVALVAQQAETWEALAEEYEQAFMRWAQEMSRSGAWTKPESERAPGPSGSFRPRFEALADAGDGRAIVWLLKNDAGAPEGREERAARDLARLAAGGGADWVAAALGIVAEDPARYAPEALGAYLAGMQAEAHPALVRAHAALADAARLGTADVERARDLRLRAAMLRWQDVELQPGEVLAP
jgi:hypothetical protein